MAEEKGKINAYICEDLHTTITENLHEGTTPMFITCRECEKTSRTPRMATSRMYRVNQSLKATHEWYNPNGEELKQELANAHPLSHAGLLEHVGKGGLLLRKKKGT